MKKNQKVILLIILFAIGLSGISYGIYSIYLKNTKQTIEEEEPEVKCNIYKDLNITSSKKPYNTHLIVEASDGDLYLVDSTDQTKLYKSIDKGESWSLITTRTKKIQTCWYIRTNEEIYFGDSDLDLTTVYIWKLTLSNDSITEIEDHVDSSFHDIFDIEVINIWSITSFDSAGDIFLRFKVGLNTWLNNMGAKGIRTYDISQACIIETDVYFLWKWSDENVELWKFNFSGGAFTQMEDLGANTELPSPNQRAIAYDGSDVFYFVLQDTSDSKFYLWTYVISTGIATKQGEYNICLMLNRNTAPGVMEKAFHITEPKVYQLHPYHHQLYFIAYLNVTGKHIIAITDNFLILDDGSMFEYVEMSSKVFRMEYEHPIMGYSQGVMQVVKDFITIQKGMFISILDYYTSALCDRLYKGTYNFKNYEDGTSGTTIDFVDAVEDSSLTTIIALFDSHRKILQNYANAKDNYFDHNITQATSGTRELWIASNEVTNHALTWIFYENGTGVLIIQIVGGNLRYNDSVAGWTVIQAISINTLYHIRLDWKADDTFDMWVNGTQRVTGGNTTDAQVSGINRVRFDTISGYKTYIDAWGDPDNDANYTIGDNKFVEGGEPDKVIFEGKVIDFDDRKLQKVWIESPALKELEKQFPKGEYSGRSDEIMASLVLGYCNYITVGTLGTGTAMGTITYGGDKSLLTIFDELAYFEKWIWYLTPQGKLYFNAGTTDSLVDLTEASKIWKLNTGEVREPYNYFEIRGAIVSGAQLYKELEDKASQQIHGFNPFSETYASFNTQGLVDQLASNIKSRLELVPLVVQYFHYDKDLGFIQPGEVNRFRYDKSEPNISQGQFLINRVVFNARKTIGDYTIADELI